MIQTSTCTILLFLLGGLQSILSQTFCWIGYECSGQSIIETQQSSIYGYKSLYGSNTSIETSNGVYCSGAFSCSHLSFLSKSSHNEHYVQCYGAYSCFGIETIIISTALACHGYHSCSNSNISTERIYCRGDKSCSYVQISNTSNTSDVRGEGAFSLYNAEIYSSRDLTVTLDGYQAGFQGTIICRAGDSCTVNCNGNGCEMLYIDCIGVCNVHTNSVATITYLSDIIDMDTTKLSTLFHSVFTIDESRCNDASTNLTFDDYPQELTSDTNLIMDINYGDPICCRAFYACRDINSIQINSGTREFVLCSAFQACLLTPITTTIQPVLCEGARACMHSVIRSNDDVYCRGVESCCFAKINEVNHLYCTAARACAVATIHGVANIYLLGDESGEDASIICDGPCSILCGGTDSCSGIISLECNGVCSVKCDADSGCPPGFTLDPTKHPSTQPTTAIPTTSPVTSNPTTSEPTTLNPTAHPTSNPTIHPTSNPTIHPTSNPTIHPTSNPTIDPTLNPTIDPTSNPTIHPTMRPTISDYQPDTTTTTTIHVQQSTPHTTAYKLLETVQADPSYDPASQSSFQIISLNLLMLTLCVSGFDALLIACCVYYIVRNLSERSKYPGNASYVDAIKSFKVIHYINIVVDLFDAVTDYLFSASLIVEHTNTGLHQLGWISLGFAIAGLAMFFFKYTTYRKLIAFQATKLRKELQACSNENRKQEIIKQIRYREMDINVISLLNGCIEDLPQTVIVLIATSHVAWDYISVLTIALSMVSFTLKASKIIATRLGCEDESVPDDTKIH
eukprot:239297_1